MNLVVALRWRGKRRRPRYSTRPPPLAADVRAITQHLQVDGIAAFTSSSEQLMATVGMKRPELLTPAPDMTPFTVFTVGHSTRTIEQFVRLLKAHAIQHVIDVRSMPRSLHTPQCAQGQLSSALERFRTHYSHMPGLGGRRHAFDEHRMAQCQLPRLCGLPGDRGFQGESESVHRARTRGACGVDVRRGRSLALPSLVDCGRPAGERC
jgi:hypothetical protein